MVYRNLVFFAPAAVCSLFSILFQYFREPKYTNYLYCFGCTAEDRPWLQWVSIIHQGFHTTMTWTILMMSGLVLVSVAQSVTSCLEILMEPGETTDQDNDDLLRNLNWRLESYSRVKKLMQDFNKLFKWQLFLQMAVIVVHLCIYVYRPLKYWSKIGALDSIISLADAVLTLFGINFSLHCGMGVVYEKSQVFIPSFRKLLASASKTLLHCWRESLPEKIIWKSPLPDRHVDFPEDVRSVNRKIKAEIEYLKLEVSSCTPFGFEGGIFFIVRANLFLTMFYSVMTHIIIMLQLDV